MTSILRLFAVFCVAALAAGAARALENPQFASDDSSTSPQRRHQPAGQAEARNANAMQALCHEILIDTDEGYGVTNRESRVICDELR